MIWTTKLLLDKIIEFELMTPNRFEWSEDKLKHNKPRLIRFQRINSLLWGFEIIEKESEKKFNFSFKRSKLQEISNLEKFTSGDFLDKKNISDYTELIQFLDKNAFSQRKPVDLHDIKKLFQKLIKYKVQFENVLGFNDGVLEASNKGMQVAIELTNNVNLNIKEQIKPIEEILLMIISPNKKEITEEDLINKYYFPIDNLEDIDFENY